MTDVSGWQCFTGQTAYKMGWNGYGKWWRYNGSIVIGEYENSHCNEGKVYKLQEDQSHTLYNVKFD